MAAITKKLVLSASVVDALVSDAVLTVSSDSVPAAFVTDIFNNISSSSDVCFTTDEAGDSRLQSKAIFWDASAEEFLFKVGIASLSAVLDSTIYMHIGPVSGGGGGTDPFESEVAAHWPFPEDDGTDYSSNGNDTTLDGGAHLGVQLGPDGVNNVGTWDGSNDRALTPSFNTLFASNTSYSISGWFYDAIHGSALQNLFETGSGADGICIQIESGTVYAHAIRSGTVYGVSETYLTGWNHVAVTVDPGGDISLYLNGSLVDTASAPETTGSSTAAGHFAFVGSNGTLNYDGSSNGSDNQVFTGALAHWTVYDAMVLSLSQVQLQYRLEGSSSSTYWTVSDATSLPTATHDLRSNSGVTLSGSSVTAWGDASQGTGSAQPTFVSTISERILGYDTIQFDGGDHLQFDDAASVFSGDEPDWTLAMLFKPETTGDYFFATGNDSNGEMRFLISGASNLQWTRIDDTNTANSSNTLAITLGDPHLYIARSEGGTGEILIRNLRTGAETAAAGAAINVASTTMLYASIGSRIENNSPDLYYIGDIARLRLYDSAIGGDFSTYDNTQLDLLITEFLTPLRPAYELRSDRDVTLDTSGNVSDWGSASQSLTARRPDFSTDLDDRILGFPVLQFESPDTEWLEWDTTAHIADGDDPNWTVAMLVRPRYKASSGVIFGWGGPVSTDFDRINRTMPGPVFNHVRRENSAGGDAGGSVSLTDDVPYLLIVKKDNNVGSILAINLDTMAEASDSTSQDVASFVGTYGAIGCNSAGGVQNTFGTFDIARIRIYDSALEGDLTGDLTGTELGRVKDDMLTALSQDVDQSISASIWENIAAPVA